MAQVISPFVSDVRWKQSQFTVTDDIPFYIKDSDLVDFAYPKLSTETVCFLQFTSGSTSQPKGVVVSHGSLLHNCHVCHKGFEFPYEVDGPNYLAGGRALNDFPFFEAFHFWENRHRSSRHVLKHRSRVFSWLPVYHDMGLIGFVCAPILFGVTIVQMSPLDFIRKPYLWLKGISDFECLCTGAPNFAYEIVSRKTPDAIYDKLDLSRVTGWLCGAEPIRASTLEKFLNVSLL